VHTTTHSYYPARTCSETEKILSIALVCTAPSTEQNGQIQSGSGYAKTPAEGYGVDLAAVTADVGYLDHSVVQSQSFSARFCPIHIPNSLSPECALCDACVSFSSGKPFL